MINSYGGLIWKYDLIGSCVFLGIQFFISFICKRREQRSILGTTEIILYGVTTTQPQYTHRNKISHP